VRVWNGRLPGGITSTCSRSLQGGPGAPPWPAQRKPSAYAQTPTTHGLFTLAGRSPGALDQPIRQEPPGHFSRLLTTLKEAERDLACATQRSRTSSVNNGLAPLSVCQRADLPSSSAGGLPANQQTQHRQPLPLTGQCREAGRKATQQRYPLAPGQLMAASETRHRRLHCIGSRRAHHPPTSTTGHEIATGLLTPVCSGPEAFLGPGRCLQQIWFQRPGPVAGMAF